MDAFTITYGHDITEQPFHVVGEEVVDNVDCWIIEYLYHPPTTRITADGKTALRQIGGKLWIGKITQEWVRLEAYNEIMDTKVTTSISSPYRIHAPLTVGKSWIYESTASMTPEFAPPSTNTYLAEVVRQEDVSVPAGMFTTYKVEFTLLASDGVGADDPIVETAMWFEAVTYLEIKRETYTVWKQIETAELGIRL